METRVPLVLALNMMDVAERRGLAVDAQKMSALMGVPVVPTVGNRGKGRVALAAVCARVADGSATAVPCEVTYGHEVDEQVAALERLLSGYGELAARYHPRWLAVKLLERDVEVGERVERLVPDPLPIREAVDRAIRSIEQHFNESAEVIIAERRYGFAAAIVRECVRPTRGPDRRTTTARIDDVVCHRLLGPVFLAAVVYALFVAVFKLADEWTWVLGRSPTGWLEWFFAQATLAVSGLEARLPLLHSVLADGVIAGVGGVMSFVPLIFVMFVFVAILEDTGYVARVAFLLDRALRAFGLQGKSVLAMIVAGGLGGGGCAVPAVMATRTLREEKDRLVTMLVAPLMNCGAKLPVYLMLIAAFFAGRQAEMLFALWGLSWVLALIAALLLRKFLVRGEQSPFVMELPPYHVPTVRGVLLHAWGRTWSYIRNAGTTILAISILLWAAMYFPRADAAPYQARLAAVGREQAALPQTEAAAGQEITAKRAAIANEQAEAQLRQSMAGRLGSALVPLSRWAGFQWRDNIALVGGFAAKEVIISTLGVAYSMGDVDPRQADSLSAKLAADPGWSRLRAAAFMVFVMVYAPCMTTVAMIRRESGSWKWALFSTVHHTAFGFLLAVVVFQAGRLLGLGA